MSENPLKQYFRQPVMHLPLPSKGKFYEEGVLDMPPTGELPIYPMTAIDEITYKTPDALFNGSAIPSIVKSCVPAFNDPWRMLTFDLNALLVAIRIATYGEEMDVSSTCPKCNATNTYTINCHHLLKEDANIDLYDEPLRFGDLEIYFKPMTYKDSMDSFQIGIEEARLEQLANNDDLTDDQKIEILTEAFKKISTYTLNAITASIRSIKTPEAIVTNSEHIQDFLRNCDTKVFEDIKNHLAALKALEDLEDLKIKCPEDDCGYEYTQPFLIDFATFFEQNS